MTNEEKYQELYKKYRPMEWADLIGQEKVAQSLRSAVAKNRIPVAFGFFGERGCGKTSAANLLARAINCENPPSPGDPCNECATCTNIIRNRQLGVHYISMANNGSTDEVRSIVEKAKVSQPIEKSVWILDEVHTIHKQAWDSLLIPLESSTMPALFILCSTESQRIPGTIMSRLKARHFKLVANDQLAEHLKHIAAQEDLEVSDELITSAVLAGRGSVRDAISRFEDLLSTDAPNVSIGDKLLEAIAANSLPKVLTAIAEADSDNVLIRPLAEQLYGDLRDILLLASGADEKLVPASPVADAKSWANHIGGRGGVLRTAEAVGDAIGKMGMSTDDRILLELALLKIVQQTKRRLAAGNK